jgi:hypothetical protein
VEFRCSWDGQGSYLAVIWSRIAVYPRDELGTEPLVRYEYIKDMRSGLPAAHVQIHGTHKALAEAMAVAGEGTTRGRRRRASVADRRLPQLAERHFPVGGHRSARALRTSWPSSSTSSVFTCPAVTGKPRWTCSPTVARRGGAPR